MEESVKNQKTITMKFKRKKHRRLLGSKTHGWGSKKKHRGGGSRGGRGRAGSGKRADSKKPSFWKDPQYCGKKGFYRHAAPKKIKAVNLAWIEEKINNLLKNKATTENEPIEINLETLGFNKLLSKGRITRKYNITVESASKGAIKKIKDSGGEVIILGKTLKNMSEDTNKKNKDTNKNIDKSINKNTPSTAG